MIEATNSIGKKMTTGQTLGSCQNRREENYQLRAPAKINLGLSVVGRRADGYHELQSLFWPIDLEDELILTPAPENRIHTFWDDDAAFPYTPLPSTKNNLALRATEEVLTGKWSLQLRKRIPIGGGLGGGSSDAAAILRFGREHCGIASEQLESTAKQLGADVPFFLTPKPAWVTGAGENRQYLNVDPQ